MVKCSIAKTLTMKHFTGFQDMLFYSCPVPPEEREKLDAFFVTSRKIECVEIPKWLQHGS